MAKSGTEPCSRGAQSGALTSLGGLSSPPLLFCAGKGISAGEKLKEKAVAGTITHQSSAVHFKLYGLTKMLPGL